MELLSKTQGHCWIWGRNLTLLVQLQSWNTQNKSPLVRFGDLAYWRHSDA